MGRLTPPAVVLPHVSPCIGRPTSVYPSTRAASYPASQVIPGATEPADDCHLPQCRAVAPLQAPTLPVSPRPQQQPSSGERALAQRRRIQENNAQLGNVSQPFTRFVRGQEGQRRGAKCPPTDPEGSQGQPSIHSAPTRYLPVLIRVLGRSKALARCSHLATHVAPPTK